MQSSLLHVPWCSGCSDSHAHPHPPGPPVTLPLPRSVPPVVNRSGMPQYKVIVERLKKRRSELWGWMRRYNQVLSSIATFLSGYGARMAADASLPPPPVVSAAVPAPITDAQMRDPTWMPADVGATRCERVERALVDLVRAVQTHAEEATEVGQSRALACVHALVATHRGLECRLAGLDAVLSGSTGAEQTDEALRCSLQQRGVARHCERSVLPPQVWMRNYLAAPDAVLNVRCGCVLRGWRAVVIARILRNHALLAQALLVLEDVLPPDCGWKMRTPDACGVTLPHTTQPTADAPPPPPPPLLSDGPPELSASLALDGDTTDVGSASPCGSGGSDHDDFP